jgi:sugar transferase (PEP-CTERM/EpsH1 system associated)
MRILNITNRIPYPPISGASLRSYNLLKRFARDNEVYLVAFDSAGKREKDITKHFTFCRGVVAVESNQIEVLSLLSKIVRWPFQGGPLELRLFFSEQLAKAIKNLVASVSFDAILIEHGCMALYFKVLPSSLRKKTVWVLHDVDFDKFQQISRIESRIDKKIRTMIHATMMRRFQPRIAEQFGLCVTMSEADKQVLIRANKRLQIEISPNGVDTHLCQPIPEAGETPAILFIGNMAYGPNIDGVVYFCSEIWPLIRQGVPDAEFWIVGMSPTERVKQLNGDGIFVTGRVPDIAPYYKRSKVCVVPLRAGSGTRLKILEAMAFGRPVVSTSIGAEGLDVVDGKNIIIENESIPFAARIINLLRDKNLRNALITEARRHVVSVYDWDVLAERLLTKLEEISN